MKKVSEGRLLYSPSDLVRFLDSPFTSWMDRYYLEHPDAVVPDEPTDEDRLIVEAGQRHERAVLENLRSVIPGLVEIRAKTAAEARAATLAAIAGNAPAIYQASLAAGQFAGFADFLLLDDRGCYQVWDTKLARSPRPLYAIQLCCYADMLADMTGRPASERFGIILGTQERMEFLLEDFIHYYRHVKRSFLAAQEAYSGRLCDCPEPQPRADHHEWTSHAERFFEERDHLVQVAGITVGQITKLYKSGIVTMAGLAEAAGRSVPKLSPETLEKLAMQARLQCATKTDRRQDPEAPPRYEVLPHPVDGGEPFGLRALPPEHPADVYFDMEGYPLAPGGLEYLFGCCFENGRASFDFADWWAHDREQEKRAFESFVDWVHGRWRAHPGMHIYHYADYEVSAVRRLSTRHDTRQDEVDDLLRHKVFVDLYRIVRRAVRIGEDSYSIKSVERLYRAKRNTEVATAADSIVQYNRWIESGEPGDWNKSPILTAIRHYNEDDCRSTASLARWLRTLARERDIDPMPMNPAPASADKRDVPPDVLARQQTAARLREQGDAAALVLADVIDFHRREEKPMWWRMFDRAAALPDERRNDPGCIEGLAVEGDCVTEKRSLLQAYRFDPSQECRLAEGDRVRFAHRLDATFELGEIDAAEGRLKLKIGKKTLDEKCEGAFPRAGALLIDEYLSPAPIPEALASVAAAHLSRQLHPPVAALLARRPPASCLQMEGEATIDAAVRIATGMSGDCLIIQGPPGTGKTFAAARVIQTLLAAGKTVGISSNSHKAVLNLMEECARAARQAGVDLTGIKVGGDGAERLVNENPGVQYVKQNMDAHGLYKGGVVGGTAWLFSRPEWQGMLDFLVIDEAGQVPLANAIAMARCAGNLILLGDQMQLEQPIQGWHPGDAGLSVLQYALKDTEASLPDVPVFHPVVPPDYGLFLRLSRRMHPAVCRFISESMYEGRLGSHADCANQRVDPAVGMDRLVDRAQGVLFSAVRHDGNTQRSDEEVARVGAIYRELAGRPFTDKASCTAPLRLDDFLFIAPYNAQVRALKAALPQGARVGSVDKFQGQEAPVCILSLGSSYGEYGPRGLAFILDRNRINVAVSRAQCLAVVVGDRRIADAVPGSLDEMKLLNLFCKLLGSN